MKFRIVELNNGSYQVQYNLCFFFWINAWLLNNNCSDRYYDTKEECERYIKRYFSDMEIYKKREYERKHGEKIKRVVK